LLSLSSNYIFLWISNVLVPLELDWILRQSHYNIFMKFSVYVSNCKRLIRPRRYSTFYLFVAKLFFPEFFQEFPEFTETFNSFFRRKEIKFVTSCPVQHLKTFSCLWKTNEEANWELFYFQNIFNNEVWCYIYCINRGPFNLKDKQLIHNRFGSFELEGFNFILMGSSEKNNAYQSVNLPKP